jgi:predicted RNA methylase
MIDSSSPAKARSVLVRVAPLPAWLDIVRFLGPFDWQLREAEGERLAEATLGARDAALLSARLRGLGLDGRPLRVDLKPPSPRTLVRWARLEEARARRDGTPGFLHTGARASDAGRFSLTPEALAMAMAEGTRGLTLVDACCGSGGNAIAFARAGARVTAIELDPVRLAEATHNARIYQVADRIEFVLGDALVELPRRRADLLFVDPPWGGDYEKRATRRTDFPLLDALMQRPDVVARYAQLWLKLPGSFATHELPSAQVRAWFGEAAGDRQRVKFLQLKCAGGPSPA